MAKTKRTKANEVPVDRRVGDDRREEDRRQDAVPVEEERRKGTRRNVNRRRQIDPTTCERDYTGDEIEFMQAMDAYKRSSGRMFPTCSEILEVVRSLGYERIERDPLDDTADGPNEGSESETLASISQVPDVAPIDVIVPDDLDDEPDFEDDEFGQ